MHFIHDNANQMYNVSEKVLEYSRVRTDKSLETPVDLNRVLNQACRNLGETLRDNKAVVEYHGLPTLPGHKPLLIALKQASI